MFEPSIIVMPHQFPARLLPMSVCDDFPPVEEDYDHYTAGDHDYHTVHVLETERDARLLLDLCRREPPHQRCLIAALTEEALEND